MTPQPTEAHRSHVADQTLTAMASLRRATRRRALRPEELSSLTGAQLELVRLVRRRPAISVAEAALELTLAPNTVSTLVRQLCELGFLVRSIDPSDRRVARLDLRPEIRRKVDAWRDRRVDVLASAISGLSVEEELVLLADRLAVTEEVATVRS
jgi:DNA-binding MarR family transcriptional regulator